MTRLTLVCLYGPNKDCPEFFTTIIRHIETLNNNTSILCGDFNVVQDPDLDYYNYCGINNKKSHEKILEIKSNSLAEKPTKNITLISLGTNKPR